jgi:membrane-associated phospholipid phosphatase
MNVLLQVVHSTDLSVYHFLNGFAGNWLADHLDNFEEGNNLLKGGFFFALYAYLWFRVDLDQEKRRRAILAILTGALLAVVVSRAIADLTPYRIRPMYDLNLPHHSYSFPISPNLIDWSSFPSDTAAYFFALAFGLAQMLRRHSAAILLYTAGWICLPRMYLGEHYLSDIVVGAAIGIAAVKASLQCEWLEQNIACPILRSIDTKPHVFYPAAFLASFEMSVVFSDVRTAAQQLIHALHGEHSHELLRAMLGLGLLGVALVAMSVVVPIFRQAYLVFSNGLRPVKIIWRRNCHPAAHRQRGHLPVAVLPTNWAK